MKREYGEFGEPKGEIKEQIKEAVEAMEATQEDALAFKKREIGENIFSEYNGVLDRKKELEEEQKGFEGREHYEELREGGKGKPLRLKEDERRKPRTLRENINRMKDDRERKGEIGEELGKINKKIDAVEKNSLLKESLAKKLEAEEKIETSFSGELIDEALTEDNKVKVELGDIVLERYKEIEKRIAKLKQRLVKHESEKPKLEGREGKEIFSFKREEEKWREERGKIEKEIEKLKEKISSKELLDIFLEEEQTEEVPEEEKTEEEVPEEEKAEEEIEFILPEPVKREAVTDKTPASEKKEKKSNSIFSKIFAFFLIIGYLFSALLEKLKKKK